MPRTPKPYLCECGEQDPRKFPANHKSRCKACAAKKRRGRNSELPLEPKRVLKDGKIQFSKQNLVRLRWQSAKNRAQRRKLPFELTEAGIQDLLKKQNYNCYYSGIYLSDFSIDRVDSSRGYTYDNVVLSHIDINFMKQEYSVEYFMYLVQAICKHQAGRGYLLT